ncbi:MAG TPA: ATP-grasp domain-containing protein [Gammaproteobacteria bacterium]|nr:ATP-grasp domain-containing protein [Gammaproteobacteria bacterium]
MWWLRRHRRRLRLSRHQSQQVAAISRRVLLIAQPGSYRIAPYLAAGARMGLTLQIASRGEHSLIAEVHAGLHVDLDDPEQALTRILREAEKNPWAAILGCDDSTVELAARAAARLNLPHNPPEAARLTRRKDLARAHLACHGCAVPPHRLLDLDAELHPQIEDIPFPCVVKPLHLSASRGVIRADDRHTLHAAIRRSQKIIAGSGDEFAQRHLLLEAYIDGLEVAYEGYLQHGELHRLCLFDKPDPLCGPFFEETIYVTPSRLAADVQQAIHHRVAEACRAYGLQTGPVHAELRVNADGVWILEVASRTIGGDCARSLDQAGFNIEELTLALAMGAEVSVDPLPEASGVMMIPIEKGGILRRVEGLGAARRTRHVEKVDVILREGQELVPLPEGNQYPGYIFARADSPEAVVRALREAHARLKFVVAPAIRLRAG